MLRYLVKLVSVTLLLDAQRLNVEEAFCEVHKLQSQWIDSPLAIRGMCSIRDLMAGINYVKEEHDMYLTVFGEEEEEAAPPKISAAEAMKD